MIKNILLHLGEDARAPARTAVAVSVAKRFDAHVLGLHPLVRPPRPSYGEVSLVDIVGGEWSRRQERARAAQEQFSAAVSAAGISAEVRVEEGEPDALVLEWGRIADLVVLGQPEEDVPSPAEDVLLALGRPVLMTPYIGDFPRVGESVAVAWNGSREAARAVQAATPFLAQAKKAALIGCDLDERQREQARRLAANLARHGADVRLELLPGGELSVGDVLLNAVSNLGADLLVMGAYGHSRMRELVFGGATRSLLAQMTTPTLFAH